jgi:adenylate cyclase
VASTEIEQANKLTGTRICISDSVVERILGFAGRTIGTVLLRGKSQVIRCHEPLPPELFGSPAIESCHKVFSLLEGHDPKAKQAFAVLVEQYEDAALSDFHLGRLLAGTVDAESW